MRLKSSMWTFPETFICADDYALHEGVSVAIRTLLAQKRISGTSAMVNMPRWPQDAELLKPLANQGAQVGLHLNLTEGVPLTKCPSLAPDGVFQPIETQLKHILKGKLNTDEIAAELAAQLQRFIDVWGAMPDFIDGHQHIHAVSLVRIELMDVVKSYIDIHGTVPWMRAPVDQFNSIIKRPNFIKAFVLNVLGHGTSRHASVYEIKTNQGFSGISVFKHTTAAAYRTEFLSTLTQLGPVPLIMCHPSVATSAIDAILPARLAEYAYLSSDEFVKDLAQRGVRVV